MSVSGIYVRIDPGAWESATAALQRLPGVDLHQQDGATGRLVLTQEADSRDSQIEAMDRIRKVPGVRLAEPVYYYPEEEHGDDPD